MDVLLFGGIALAVCVALAMVAFFSIGLGRKTCHECGGGLPVISLPNQPDCRGLGDWACPKCGTRFDRQGRARDQLIA